MARKRLKAAKLEVLIDGTSYQADVTSLTITNEDADSDTITFMDVGTDAGRDWTLNISAVQDTSTESFWRLVWDHTGETVSATVAPHGNATPTADEPHFVINEVVIGAPPTIGGEATTDGTWTFDTEWKIKSGKPTLDEGTGV